jgi:hypothetical protein
MQPVNERAGKEVKAYFKTVSGDPTIPPTAHWRLVDTTYNNDPTILQDWTAEEPEPLLDPTSGALLAVRIICNIDGAHNRTTRGRRESREVQVVAAMDTPYEWSAKAQYFVLPMAGGRS